MSEQPAVHVVDDEAAMRNSLRALLESAALEVCVYESAESFLESLGPPRHGCLLTDLRMPGMSGIDLLRHLRAIGNNMPAIIISGNADVPAVVQLMKLGAIDMLEKPFDHTALLDVVAGAIKKSEELMRHRSEIERVQSAFAQISPREEELLRLVVKGRSNKQIAMDMDIAVKTVINHRANLMTKTQALNAADLARMATLAGVLLVA